MCTRKYDRYALVGGFLLLIHNKFNFFGNLYEIYNYVILFSIDYLKAYIFKKNFKSYDVVLNFLPFLTEVVRTNIRA